MLRTLTASLMGIGLATLAAGAMAQSHVAQTPQPRLTQMDRDHLDRDRDRGREQAQGAERRQDSNGRFGLDRDRGRDRADDRRLHNDHDADDHGIRR